MKTSEVITSITLIASVLIFVTAFAGMVGGVVATV